MPKVLIIAGVSVLALGLVLGLALPALAAAPWADDSQTRVVRGEVLSVGDQEFVIQSGEQELTISVDGNTKYFRLCVPGRIMALARHQIELRAQDQLPLPGDVGIPRLQRAGLRLLHHLGGEAEFGDIAVGDRVVVWLAPGENNLAQRMLIIKPTTYANVSGTITDISPSAITIAPADGEPVTLSYNESTVFVLSGFIAVEEGQYARAIYDSDNMVAKRVTVSLISD
jgi:hypothetical protein